MTEKSILDARLAEIDRRLRTIQSGLAPAAGNERPAPAPVTDAAPAEPAAPSPVVPPEAAPIPKRLPDTPDAHGAAMLVAELRALVEAHERLLASSRALLDARTAPDPQQAPVGLSVGPFASTQALRGFERSLQALPEVRAVHLREYEGTDRVVIDVHLAQPNP